MIQINYKKWMLEILMHLDPTLGIQTTPQTHARPIVFIQLADLYCYILCTV